jgi:apoptotic chromatin condensation inducer in the nucleus
VFIIAHLDDEHTTEDGLVRRKDVSPARYPVDRVLHIRCLTRPFTVKALMELLERFGTVLKDEFWIDTIKTNCLVKVND